MNVKIKLKIRIWTQKFFLLSFLATITCVLVTTEQEADIKGKFYENSEEKLTVELVANKEGFPEKVREIEKGSPFEPRKNKVTRGQKIWDWALFEAIRQGSLGGVHFLVEGGANSYAENNRYQTPLDFAENLEEEFSEESEYQKIAHFFPECDFVSNKVDDGRIVATAREVCGLRGGRQLGFRQEEVEAPWHGPHSRYHRRNLFHSTGGVVLQETIMATV